MRVFLILFSFVILTGCQTATQQNRELKRYEGYLYFKQIDLFNFNNLSKSQIDDACDRYMKALNDKSIGRDIDKALGDIKLLRANDLIYKPSIHLRLSNSQKVITIYLEEEDYNQINVTYQHVDLRRDNKRLYIGLDGLEFNSHIVECTNLDFVRLVGGKTEYIK